jgi:hypothetical protein
MPAPCSLLLEVFESISLEYDAPSSDIVAWEVSNDPAHVHPWLLAPRQYAEQDIDPVACTASIGQVEVGVIDPPEDPDDQDTGWMTARVHDLLGRRCRLRRYIDDTIGWVTIVDGPAGMPSMDTSYSAYRWAIRDTRDTERKLTAFTFGGTSAIMPRGSIYGFGHYTDLTGDHVLLPSLLSDPHPIWGLMQVTLVGGRWIGVVDFSAHYVAQVDPTAPTLATIHIWNVSLQSINTWANGWRSAGQDPYDMWSGYGNQGLDAIIVGNGITVADFNAQAVALGITFESGTAWISGYRDALVTALANPLAKPLAPLIDDPRLDLDNDAVIAVQTTEVASGLYGAQTADVLWRVKGTTPWNLSRPTSPINQRTPVATSQAYNNGPSNNGVGLTSVLLFNDASAPGGFPANGAVVEIIVRHRGAASDPFPYYVEGLLGDVLRDLYDGFFSLTPLEGISGMVYDPAALDDIPATLLTSVRYDSAAFDGMTDPVLLRQTAPVTDGRAWTETAFYAPSGWIPALDNDALISPILRSRPTVIDATLALTNARAVPTPGWSVGSRTVSEVNYQYSRFFIPATDADFTVSADGLAIRPITVTFRDSNAELRYGQQPINYDASAFSSIGGPYGESRIGQQEAAHVMAQAANLDILERYRSGVQTFSINARRAALPTVRVGTWIPWNLSWLPNRASGTRGSIVDAAQIVGIRDDNCIWRTLILEESAALGSLGGVPGYVDALAILMTDEGDPGLNNLLVVISDESESLPGYNLISASSLSFGSGGTLGYSFNVTAPFLVTHLAVWDEGSDGLGEDHDVGLWNPAGVLLASGNIPIGAGSELRNGFRLLAITPVLLLPDVDYRVGAYMAHGADGWRYDAGGGLPATTFTPPGITFYDAMYNLDVAIVRPDSSGGSQGYFGGNFFGYMI